MFKIEVEGSLKVMSLSYLINTNCCSLKDILI